MKLFLFVLISELIKFYRTASGDPERRPIDRSDLQSEYDFVIVGEYLSRSFP